MFRLIAHAGETHGGTAESATHWLESWYIAVPLFILLIYVLGTAIYLISKRSVATTYLSVVAVLLFSGIYFYDKSSVLSAVAITVGLLGSLLSVLAFLSASSKVTKR